MRRQMDIPCPKCGYDPNTLTPRELEVENLLITTDLGTRQIADRLDMSEKTAEAHKRAVFWKRQVHSRAGLILKMRCQT